MYQTPLVLRTKLTPPRAHKHTLYRSRLTARFLEAADYRLTLVQAGAGYGKTTALAALIKVTKSVIWYHLDEEDADPLPFLLHLVHGFQEIAPGIGEGPLALLEEWAHNGRSQGWTTGIDLLVNAISQHINQPVFLVLDDAHQLQASEETLRLLDRFIGRSPDNIHVILSSRYPLKLPTLLTWRVRGELLEIDQDELAFTQIEIASLFQEHYQAVLSPHQAQLLAERLEGWPIAFPLLWQQRQADQQADWTDWLAQRSGASDDLFAYLAQEVLGQQPPDIQEFLQTTAVLRQMTVPICDCLRTASNSHQILRYLSEQGLFIVDMGNGHLRYHHLFRDLLRHQLDPENGRAAHQQAALCYQQRGQTEEALYHFLQATDYNKAAALLVTLGKGMVRAGRLDSLANWIGTLPPDILAGQPPLMTCLGDIARLQNRFDEALGWYQQVEQSSRLRNDWRGLGEALRGQARVYLDTVNPSQAEQLLQEALRISDGREEEDRASRIRLLDLLAENLLNQGRMEEAARYQTQSRSLRQAETDEEAVLSLRVLLRTGQLDTARRLLEARLAQEQTEPIMRNRAHREPVLLLALILAFQGESEATHRYAVAGMERGQMLGAPFTTAVGHMRRGHAWLLQKNEAGYTAAQHCFEQAITISDTIDVPRLKVEAYWGLCQVYGFRGDSETAVQFANRGIKLAQNAGDGWVEACIRVSMGSTYVLAGQYDTAVTWLTQANNVFRECGDSFGETVSLLWQSLIWLAQNDTARLIRDSAACLQQTRQHHYEFLWQRRTLLGPPDPRNLVPVLLFAREHLDQGNYAQQLLTQLGLSQVQFHPGYQLRIQAFGPFSVWRGSTELDRAGWQRKKALQLFQFFLTRRHQMLYRDQIIDQLWPELTPAQGERDFKIAYSGLCNVLEPERARNAPSAYILRDGTLYGLRPQADIWLDVTLFEQQIAQGDGLYNQNKTAALSHYQQALTLYQGDFLAECRYEDWCSEERERLAGLYLHTAERTAQTLSAQQEWEAVLVTCQAILSQDDCWEEAYRLMMTAYARLGNRSQVSRTYQRCCDRLQAELGVSPTALTRQTYETSLAHS